MTGKIATRLQGLEVIIERGRASFIEVGKALAAIKAEGLYSEEFGTFEAYCQERWGFGKRYANMIIESSETVAALPPGTIVPATESQARQLSRVTAEKRAEVMQAAASRAATENRTVTAQDIAAAAIQPTPPVTYPPTDPLAEWQGEPEDVPNTAPELPTRHDETKFRAGVRKSVSHRLIYIDEGKCSRKEAFRLMAHAAITNCTEESLISAEEYRSTPRNQLAGWIENEDRSSTDLLRLVFEVTVMAYRGSFQWDMACTLADVNQEFMKEQCR